MKTVIFIIAMVITFTVNAQKKDSTKQDSTKVTASQVYKDVKNVLGELGKALKVGSEHVYEVLVKQQIVNSIVWLILGVMATVLLFLGYFQIKAVKWDKYSDGPVENTTINLLFGIGELIVGVIMTMFFVFHIDVIVMGFTNPEYGALKDILSLIGK